MTLHEIRESGLLELYVLGDLALHDRSVVEAAIAEFPELSNDLKEIERAYRTYAEAHAVKAPPAVLEKILLATSPLDDVFKVDNSATPPNPWFNRLLTLALAGFLAVFGYYLVKSSNSQDKLESEMIQLESDCEEKTQVLENRLALYKLLNLPQNKAVEVSATDKYPETKMILNTNEASKRNFIQFKFLPPLQPNQSYQLWSLKGDSDPIPLNVFEDISELLEVDFIDDTNAYAITIEPKGGGTSPTLEELIGVFSIQG